MASRGRRASTTTSSRWSCSPGATWRTAAWGNRRGRRRRRRPLAPRRRGGRRSRTEVGGSSKMRNIALGTSYSISACISASACSPTLLPLFQSNYAQHQQQQQQHPASSPMSTSTPLPSSTSSCFAQDPKFTTWATVGNAGARVAVPESGVALTIPPGALSPGQERCSSHEASCPFHVSLLQTWTHQSISFVSSDFDSDLEKLPWL